MDKLLNIKEVSEILSLSQDRCYSLARSNILPSCRIGRTIRFSSNALSRFIEQGGKSLPGGSRHEVV